MSASDAMLAIGILAIIWSFYRAHRNPNFDFSMFDLLMEHGRVSKVSCVFMGSFAATTWVIIRLALDGKLTEIFFAAYISAWVVPVVARMFSNPAVAPLPSVTTTSVAIDQVTKTN